jgi:Ca2+/H+ antiporter
MHGRRLTVRLAREPRYARSAVGTALINLDGETTWPEGPQLVAFYAMVAATAFFLK